MEKTHYMKSRAKTYKPNFAVLLLAFVILLMINIVFSSCKDDTETSYTKYGTVEKTSNTDFRIKLDEGATLNPRESFISGSELSDSMRLIVDFTILEELDSSYNIKLNYAKEILTKPILPYNDSILDSLGNDPIKVIDVWITYGFINFDFLYSGNIPTPSVSHMVNLLQHPLSDGKVILEFRHNAFGDKQETMYGGVVSFPIAKLLEGIDKTAKIQIQYKDSPNSTKTIDLTY